MMQPSKSKLIPSAKHKLLPRRPMQLLRQKEKPERHSRLLLTRQLWLTEEPDLKRNLEMSGLLVLQESLTYR